MQSPCSMPGALALVTAAVLALTACVDPGVPQPPVPNLQRGLWVWSNLPAVQAGPQQQLLDLAADHAVTTLYLQAQTLIYDDPAALHELIQNAALRGLQVELLAGNHTWVWPANHAATLQLARDLRDFALSQPGARPTALHFNIEPHALPEWPNAQTALAQALLDLLEQLHAELAGSGLALVLDIPNWYDDIQVQRDGKLRPLSELVQDRVDRVVVMDYRDNPALMLQLAQTELAYGDAVGKPVVIAAESRCLADAELTWCEEGRAALAAGLAAVRNGAAHHPSFGGTAVHDWQGLAELGP